MTYVDRIFLTQTHGRRNFFLKIGVFQGHIFNLLLIGSIFAGNRINGIILQFLLHHCIHKKLDAIFHHSIALKKAMNLRRQWFHSSSTSTSKNTLSWKKHLFLKNVVLNNANLSKKEIPMWLLFLLYTQKMGTWIECSVLQPSNKKKGKAIFQSHSFKQYLNERNDTHTVFRKTDIIFMICMRCNADLSLPLPQLSNAILKHDTQISIKCQTSQVTWEPLDFDAFILIVQHFVKRKLATWIVQVLEASIKYLCWRFSPPDKVHLVIQLFNVL